MSNLSQIVNKISILKQIPIFSHLNWVELHTVAHKCIFLEFKKGEIIYKQDSPPDAFYCLVSGRLHAYRIIASGGESNREFIHRGMHFGIVSLLTNENHSLTFEAINDSIILKIPKDDFADIIKQIPRLGVEFSHSLSKRIARRESRLELVFESTIISIYSPTKAAGSSTYAINLALNLEQETGQKVILVSVNSNKQKPSDTVSKIDEASPYWKKEAWPLEEIIDDEKKIMSSIAQEGLKVDLLNVIFDPKNLSLIEKISHFVTLLARDYHYVVVDLPNEMDDVVFKTLTQSDVIHLITFGREDNLQPTREIINNLKTMIEDSMIKERVRVLVSGIGPKSFLSYEEINEVIEFDAYTMLPQINSEELNTVVESKNIKAVIPRADSEYAQAVRKIAREIGRVLVGLVLGGGAAFGLAHIGVIRVLERERIPIDIVVGCSMGALIGSLWVLGQDADGIEKAAKEFSRKSTCLQLLDFVFPKAGLIGGRSIRRWLKKRIGNKTFYSTKMPFKVVAYDLVKREELVVCEGRVIDAVRQSIAIPGVMTPVVKKDQLIIDGGVVNPLPTDVLTSLGIKKIIAVNVLQSPLDVAKGYNQYQEKLKQEEAIPFTQSPLRYLSVRLKRLFSKMVYPNISDIIIRSFQATQYAMAEQNAQQADVAIRPNLVGLDWYELYRVDRLIRIGEEAAERQLDNIKKLISEP